jgi:Metal-dependent hydrolase
MEKEKKKIIKGIIGSIVAAIVVIVLVFVIGNFGYLARYKANKTEISLSASANDNIRVMSCNVRCRAIQDFGKKSWYYRAEFVAKNISNVQPDILGFQEVTKTHYAYLTDFMQGYDSVIQYRDETSLSEGCPIFYRTDKYVLIDKGSFWLSDTPDVMSKNWGSSCYRICSYVILKQKSDNREIVVFNTHLDHVSDEARINGIKVVLDKISEFGDKPSILMGDLNAVPESETIKNATQSFLDAQVVAENTMDGATYQAWGEKLNKERIDYIMVSKTGIKVNDYVIVQTTYDGVYPSDHFPIYANITLI